MSAERPFHIAPWEWTLSCGLIKIAIAVLAAVLPLLQRPLPSSVGWMLLAGGATELALSWRGRQSWVGRLTFGSGAVTVLAGGLLINSRWAGLFPLAHFIVAWLLVRGMISIDVAVQSRQTPAANWFWLMLRGAVDTGLGLVLLVGAPLVMFTLAIFGETNEIVAAFCDVLAISFLTAGVALVAISLAQRRRHLADPFLSDPPLG